MDQGLHLADARYKKIRALIADLFGITSTPSGSFLAVVNVISPDPGPGPGIAAPAAKGGVAPRVPPPVLFAIPNDNQLDPSGTVGVNYVWTFPGATHLKRCHLHGKAATIGTVNTLGGPAAHNVDLYINGVFVRTLFTLAAGATDVDLVATPDTAIALGDEVQFVIPAGNSETGELANFQFSFSIGA